MHVVWRILNVVEFFKNAYFYAMCISKFEQCPSKAPMYNEREKCSLFVCCRKKECSGWSCNINNTVGFGEKEK